MMLKAIVFVFAICCGCTLVGCAGQTARPDPGAVSTKANQPAADTPLPAETNPPGDIPDSQVFVTYHDSRDRMSVEYPEGWTQTSAQGNVTFEHDFNGEAVYRGHGATGWSAIRDAHATTVQLPAGKAILRTFTSNSRPNVVTGKRTRLQNNTYIFNTLHGAVSLELWAPLGADNIDQWKRIATSFRTH
ncbi:MAG: hypothetical protein M3N19_10660 [Candidatus Eremiobacteraeota bacterium]|nr:hypothetical protein [Candidatus Eremiobacteraeota bacterium]